MEKEEGNEKDTQGDERKKITAACACNENFRAPMQILTTFGQFGAFAQISPEYVGTCLSFIEACNELCRGRSF